MLVMLSIGRSLVFARSCEATSIVTTACEVLGAARAAQGQKVNSKKRIEVTIPKERSTFYAMTMTVIGILSRTIL